MTSPSIPVTGGCLCGAIRYVSATAPIKGFYCHCTMCQKHSGGLYSASVRFKGTDFAITQGDLKYYRSSSFARRGFCPTCGSPIAFNYDGSPDIWILFGSLDRPGDWPLSKEAEWGEILHLCIETKVAWSKIDDGLVQLTTEQFAARIASQGVPIKDS